MTSHAEHSSGRNRVLDSARTSRRGLRIAVRAAGGKPERAGLYPITLTALAISRPANCVAVVAATVHWRQNLCSVAGIRIAAEPIGSALAVALNVARW